MFLRFFKYMSFEDLKLQLKNYFLRTSKTVFLVQKMRVHERFDFAVRQKESKLHKFFKISEFYIRKSFVGIMAVSALVMTGVINAPFFSNQVAGKISSLGGVVEIVRGDERFLVHGEIPLLIGDSIFVGHRGKAKIDSYNTSSELVEGCEIKIESSDKIFLKKGSIRQTAHHANEIKTERSIIQNPLGSAVEVYVSETGETSIYPLAKNIIVSDLYEGNIKLNRGEKIKISSDTVLKDYSKVVDLNLSKTQINSILGKLVITRTKLLQGMDLMTKGQRQKSFEAFGAAKLSYMSIAQILHSDRGLTRIVPQNTKIISLSDVHEMIQSKIKNIEILTESKALNIVFLMLERSRYSLVFAPVNSKSENFNKYVLLQYLAGMAERKDKKIIEYLADNYVIASQQMIMRTMDKVLQEKILKRVLKDIPDNKYGEKFEITLKSLLPEAVAL